MLQPLPNDREKLASYGPAKRGLITSSKAIAVNLGPHGIRVNSISPGTHNTEMNRYHWENETDTFKQSISILLGRAAKAKEITGAVCLCFSLQMNLFLSRE